MSIQKLTTRRKINFEQFSDLLYKEWENGRLSNESREYLMAGIIPLHIIKRELNWELEKAKDGDIYVTMENKI